MHRRVLPFLVLAVLMAGCAQPYSPTGGEVLGVPLRVVDAEPKPFSIAADHRGAVVIRFGDRVSERNLADAVRVSPETGEVKVSKRGRDLRVSIKGGWQPDQIYRIVIRPVLQDLYGNPMEEMVDVIFSTGPEIPATAVAGLVTDRLTRKPVERARVEAIRAADSAVYVAETDTAGYFALRHIPEGEYAVRAYLDRTPNREPDFGEPIDTAMLELGASDTTIFTFDLLAPDTTPARVTRAEAPDSLTIKITLDDHLDPEVPLDGVVARVWKLPDSTSAPVAEVIHLHVHEKQVEEQRRAEARKAAEEAKAAEDPDTVMDPAPDSAQGPVRDPAAAPRPGAGGEPGGAATPDEVARGPLGAAEPESSAGPLPTRELVVRLAEPLEPQAEYRITLEGVRNINGLEDGGGTVTFRAPAMPSQPDPDPEGQPDTPDIPPDTSAVAPPRTTPPDTGSVPPPDTSADR